MPYKDPEKQREAQARSYRKRLENEAFKAEEAARKAEYQARNLDKLRERVARFRAKRKR